MTGSELANGLRQRGVTLTINGDLFAPFDCPADSNHDHVYFSNRGGQVLLIQCESEPPALYELTGKQMGTYQFWKAGDLDIVIDGKESKLRKLLAALSG